MKTPLFDLGNVIVQIDFDPFIHWACSQANASNQERLIRRFHSDKLYIDYEFGRISSQEFAKYFCLEMKIPFDYQKFCEMFCAIFPQEITGINAVIQKLKSRGAVYCLSNTNQIHLDYCKNRFNSTLNLFDNIFSSYELEMRKPDPQIYLNVADQIGTETKDIIFFDDNQDNIDGAKEAGMEAYFFESAAQVAQLCAI